MHKVVHILNGDSTSLGIKEGAIEGDCIVWREMLTEGPLSIDIVNDDFWNKRNVFFENEFSVDRLEYYDKTHQELTKIKHISNYNEVVLWFEYDLFCQVNLIALCTYLLSSYKDSIDYYLVCTGRKKGEEHLQTLSDYAPNEYKKLLESRSKLSQQDLLFAKECWEKYVSNDLYELKAFNFAKNIMFKYLQLVMNQHMKRFADKSGLNQIDYKILDIIDSNIFTKKNIVSTLLIWQKKETVYGFGNLQYVRYLNKLSSFYEINNERYFLNQKGRNLLK